jgi:hypothetical protein
VIVSPCERMPQPGIGDLSEAEDEQFLSRPWPKARVVFRASSDDAPLGCGCIL